MTQTKIDCLAVKYAGNGRFPKLTRNKIKKIVEFYETAEATYDSPVTFTTKNGTSIEKMEEKPNKIPTDTSLAKHLGVSYYCVWNWKKKYPEFNKLLDLYKNGTCKDIVVQNGLLGLYNAQFAKAYLENESTWNNENDTAEDKKPPNQTFNTQINNYFAQQGLQVQEIKQLTGQLPAFEEEAKKVNDSQNASDS